MMDKGRYSERIERPNKDLNYCKEKKLKIKFIIIIFLILIRYDILY